MNVAAASAAPARRPFTLPVAFKIPARPNAWVDTEGGKSKLRPGGDGSVIFENEDGTFSFAHCIEGIGNVPGPKGSRFTKIGYAALMADIDYSDLDVPTMMTRFASYE